MNKHIKKTWGKFQQAVVLLDDKSGPEVVFLLIRNWLLEHDWLLDLDEMKIYHIDKYINIDINSCPVSHSSLKDDELVVFKKNIALPDRNLSGIARIIRDTLESLIIFEADKSCEQCGKHGLGVYMTPHSNKVVLECGQCGYAMYDNDHPYNKDEEIVPATEKVLRLSGYI